MKSKASILIILFSITLMCFSVSVSAALEIPNGFLGIPWGANREQIIKSINGRGYTTQEIQRHGRYVAFHINIQRRLLSHECR